MRKLLLLFAFSMISYNSNKVELDKIQLMAYNYDPNYSIQKLSPNAIIYSLLNSSAESIYLRKNDAKSDPISTCAKPRRSTVCKAKLKNKNF